jgi:imidazolonepropionase-like amidohydrolase
LPHTAVVVESAKIVRVGPTRSITIPAGAQVVEGWGRVLIPGLADMHMHIDRAEELPLFLAAGVTTTLNMGEASPAFVTETRREVERGELGAGSSFLLSASPFKRLLALDNPRHSCLIETLTPPSTTLDSAPTKHDRNLCRP